MNDIRIRNKNNLIVGNLNINSYAGKFDQFRTIIKNNLDIFVIKETKRNDSFLTPSFILMDFLNHIEFEKNKHGGGVLIYVKESILSKQLYKHNFTTDIERMFIEINLRKTKWLLFGTYHPPSNTDKEYFQEIELALDYSSYEKFLLVGDFNAEESEPCLNNFLYHRHAKNLVKEKICFKSINNPSCIDMFLTNSYRSF